MLWETTNPVANLRRREFVARVLSPEKSKSALCREYGGISRVTGDKWLRRWQEGCDDLAARSHAPRSARLVEKAQNERPYKAPWAGLPDGALPS